MSNRIATYAVPDADAPFSWGSFEDAFPDAAREIRTSFMDDRGWVMVDELHASHRDAGAMLYVSRCLLTAWLAYREEWGRAWLAKNPQPVADEG